MFARYSVMERSLAVKILAIDIRTVGQEELRKGREPFTSGATERRSSPWLLKTKVPTVGEENPSDFDVPAIGTVVAMFNGRMERRSFPAYLFIHISAG
jgi:hypothetical protein